MSPSKSITDESSRARAPLRLRATLAWSAAIGLVGGAIGFAYLAALHALEHAVGPGARDPWIQLGILSGAGVLAAWLVRRLGSCGDMELLVDNVHVLDDEGPRVRDLRALVPVSLVCISTGGGAGPEAPLVQTSGTLARRLALSLRLAPIDQRVMTISGMAAAFTVLFGAPVGAALFALEILHRKGLEYHEALLPGVVASLVGYAVYVGASGLGLTPVWHIDLLAQPVPLDLLWSAVAGVAGAVVAVAFILAVRGATALASRLGDSPRFVAGGVLLGLLGLASPYALTYGKYQIDPLLASAAPLSFFLSAAAAKFAGTTVTLACGWRGGFIIPLFFIGAALAHAVHFVLPGTNEAVLACAMMAAINTGVTKTPLGSTLVVSKMVGLSLVPTTAVAAVVALLLTHRAGLMESQRERVEVRAT